MNPIVLIGFLFVAPGTLTGFSDDALAELTARDGDGSAAARAGAYRRFQAMPMPSPDTEEWRHTDLRELDLSAYRALAEEEQANTLEQVKPEVQEVAGSLGERSGLAIQHNSTMVLVRVDPDVRKRGVVLESIEDAARNHPGLLDGRLHRAVPPGRTRFTALHAAFRAGGTFVHVPAGVRVEAPLQTLTYLDLDGLAVFPHTVVVLEEGAELTYLDRYVSPAVGAALSDAVVELYLGPNSRLSYACMQDWGPGVTHLGVQRAHLQRDAELRSLAVAVGADLSRMEAESVMEGEGSSSEMLGVYLGERHQHFDFRSIQDHVGSRTASDLLYKGAMKGRSSAIYSGTVVIREGAHKCNAYQTNRNVLLSENAKAFSIPNLEILTNDPVRCGHAASTGPVDDDTMFYIQSRGIPFKEAERLVVFGFFHEVLDRVRIPEVRTNLEAAIAAELEGGDA